MNAAVNAPQPAVQNRSLIAALARHFPPGQFGRYLLVGGFNTVFGYGCFALFVAILDRITPHGYILASVLSGLINITVAYFNYKWFVFKTKGKYLREWARCVVVYSGAIAINTLLLPVLVFAIRRWSSFSDSAPYIAGAVLIGGTTIYSFVGHKNFSFRTSPEESA